MATIATIIAILFGPLLAVQAQKWIERLHQRRDEKIKVFVTLLTTKGRLVPEHVQALNAIYFFFRGAQKKDKAVVEAWDLYRDHLNNGVEQPKPQADGKVAETDQTKFNADLERWSEKGDDLLCNLLKKMAESLGYDFPDLLLKKGAYTPQGYADVEFHQRIILKGLSDILLGSKDFPMQITGMPVNEKAQKLLIAFLEGKYPLPIRIDGSLGDLADANKIDKSRKS